MQETRVDSFYEKLLASAHKANPELARKLMEKYDADRSEFTEAVKASTPSQDPRYWSKNSCRKCCGKGTVGTLYEFEQPARTDGKRGYSNCSNVKVLVCTCVNKAYMTWLKHFRAEYNKTLEKGDKDESQA